MFAAARRTCSPPRPRRTIATGILNIWMHTPEETAAQHAALTAEHGPRFLVRHRRQPRARSSTASTSPARTTSRCEQMVDVPRRARRRRHAAGPGRPVPRRARPEDARAEQDAHRRHPPVPRDARAQPQSPARRVGPDALVASEQAVVLDTNPRRPGPPPARTSATYLGAAQLLEQLEAHRASPTTTSPTAAATGSSTRSWRGATRTTIVAAGAGAPRRRRQPRLHPGARAGSRGCPPASGGRSQRAGLTRPSVGGPPARTLGERNTRMGET